MSLLAPTLEAFLSELSDYVELGARCLVIRREVVEVVCIASPHPRPSRNATSASGGR